MDCIALIKITKPTWGIHVVPVHVQVKAHVLIPSFRFLAKVHWQMLTFIVVASITAAAAAALAAVSLMRFPLFWPRSFPI